MMPAINAISRMGNDEEIALLKQSALRQARYEQKNATGAAEGCVNIATN